MVGLKLKSLECLKLKMGAKLGQNSCTNRREKKQSATAQDACYNRGAQKKKKNFKVPQFWELKTVSPKN